jgi:hypothetical protein
MNQQTKEWKGTTKEWTNKQSNRQMMGDGTIAWIVITQIAKQKMKLLKTD